MRRSTRTWAVIIAALPAIATACQKSDGINQFHPTSVAGWDCHDTLLFHLPPTSAAHDFDIQVQARVTPKFPLDELWLVVEQSFGEPDSTSRLHYADTAKIRLSDANGILTGNGRHLLEYQHPIRFVHLHEGEGGQVRIRQVSDYEKIPGVHDIGIAIVPIK